MHLELVVPALLPPASAPAAAEAPSLERLLARGRRGEARPQDLEAWLADAFGLEEGPLPAGALTALAAGEAPGSALWLRADPVHLRADRDRVLLLPAHAFGIDAAEAQALAAALAPLLAGELSLFAFGPEQWCLRVDAAGAEAGASLLPPIALAAADVDPHLPDKRWHRLLTEIQMTLYRHPANAAREQRGAPAVNSVWLWGAGRLPAGASAPWHSVSAGDPAALGLARLAGLRQRAPGGGAEEWLGRAPEDGRHLVLLEQLRGAHALGDAAAAGARLRELEARWFAPLRAALRSGRVGMVTVHVPEAGLAVETTAADLRRFWRRDRPLAAYAERRP
ncbi:MAG TPA: hypothetical protein VMI15_02890 [Burkholderiales bacterium]|nr:hypothetical protein [Burkholderiales bacterium]